MAIKFRELPWYFKTLVVMGYIWLGMIALEIMIIVSVAILKA